MKEIEKPSLVVDEISPDGRYGKFVWDFGTWIRYYFR